MVVVVVVVGREVVVLLFFSECQAEALLVPAPTPGNLIATDSSSPLPSSPSPSLLIHRLLLIRRCIACWIARSSLLVWLYSFSTAILYDTSSRELNRILQSLLGNCTFDRANPWHFLVKAVDIDFYASPSWVFRRCLGGFRTSIPRLYRLSSSNFRMKSTERRSQSTRLARIPMEKRWIICTWI